MEIIKISTTNPNFGKLLRVEQEFGFNMRQNKKCLDVVENFANSKAMQRFCDKYDVVACFSAIGSEEADMFNSANLALEYCKENTKGILNIFYDSKNMAQGIDDIKDACIGLGEKIQDLTFRKLEKSVIEDQESKKCLSSLSEKFNSVIGTLMSWNKDLKI